METKVTWTDKTKEPTHFIPLSEFVELTDDIETIRKYAKLCTTLIVNVRQYLNIDEIYNTEFGTYYHKTLTVEKANQPFKFTKLLSKILEEI